MIIRKLDKAKRAYDDAVEQVITLLTTKRGASEARAELNEARQASLEDCVCVYCGEPIVDRAPRHLEACIKCGNTIDRMLQLKSRVLANPTDVVRIRQLLRSYDELNQVPYALRGSTGDAEDLKRALDTLSVAAANYKAEKKASIAREAAINVAEQRRAAIRKMLIDFGMDGDSPETDHRVEEIYASEQNG